MLRNRISDPCVCSSIGPRGSTGFDRSKKLSSVCPSTVALAFSHTQTRDPIILILKVFHCPTGLSAFTSGQRPGLSGLLFHRPPDPFGAPFFTSRGLSGSHTCT